jgi:hypothetical protein
MCNVDPKKPDELTGLAARFIAETNAFLDRFWVHPSVGWPSKLHPPGDAEAPSGTRSAAHRRTVPPNSGASGELVGIAELVARLRRLQQPPSDGGNGSVTQAPGDPGVYLIVVLVPEEPPCPSAESIIRARRILGVGTDNGGPICADAPPAPPVAERMQPRRRRKATSAA